MTEEDVQAMVARIAAVFKESDDALVGGTAALSIAAALVHQAMTQANPLEPFTKREWLTMCAQAFDHIEETALVLEIEDTVGTKARQR